MRSSCERGLTSCSTVRRGPGCGAAREGFFLARHLLHWQGEHLVQLALVLLVATLLSCMLSCPTTNSPFSAKSVQRHMLVVHTIRRSIHNKCQWKTRAIKLTSAVRSFLFHLLFVFCIACKQVADL